ncbi:3'-5' exoribonuclease [bacterium]|nr:3'-5' exoribonuclease [bacterium]
MLSTSLNSTFIGFDTETTGRYPIESEICEIAAVKYTNGKIIDSFQSLIKPKRPMGEEVIKIHGITNEMVQNAPPLKEVLPKFRQFIDDGILIAHHAPFDLGFITAGFEECLISLPTKPVICSSRLSRNTITDSENHKLQTLIKHLGLPQGTAHRALDDATACLQVALHCFEKAQLSTLEDIFKKQDGELHWKDYSVEELKFQNKSLRLLIEAMVQRTRVRMTYKSGSKPGRERIIEPIGLVRSPDGDFFVAYDDNPVAKRFYLNKLGEVNKI